MKTVDFVGLEQYLANYFNNSSLKFLHLQRMVDQDGYVCVFNVPNTNKYCSVLIDSSTLLTGNQNLILSNICHGLFEIYKDLDYQDNCDTIKSLLGVKE